MSQTSKKGGISTALDLLKMDDGCRTLSTGLTQKCMSLSVCLARKKNQKTPSLRIAPSWRRKQERPEILYGFRFLLPFSFP